jgi:hypothetical protein
VSVNSTSPGPIGSVESTMITSKRSRPRPHEVGAVGDHEIEPRVVEGAGGDARQVFAREIDHAGVDLDHGDMLDARCLQHLARHAAIAAADDQHPRRRAMGEDRHMGQHLVVDEIVALGDLHHAVQRQDPAEGRFSEDAQALVLGGAVVSSVSMRKACA